MGLRYRKSFGSKAGRVTVSKSGVGFSVGTKGFRATKKAGGGYRTTSSIPGTGISYVSDYGSASGSRSRSKSQGKGCGCFLSVVVVFLALAVVGICGEILNLDEDTSVEQETAVVEPKEESQDEVSDVQIEDQQEEETVPTEQEQAIQSSASDTLVDPELEDPAIIPPADPLGGLEQESPLVSQSVQAEEIVYYTDTGSKYHRAGCRHLSESKHETTLDYAVNVKGLTPCGTCH